MLCEDILRSSRMTTQACLTPGKEKDAEMREIDRKVLAYFQVVRLYKHRDGGLQ